MELTIDELKKHYRYVWHNIGVSHIQKMTFDFLNKKGYKDIVDLFQDIDFYNNFDKYFENSTEEELYSFYKAISFVYAIYNKFKIKLKH